VDELLTLLDRIPNWVSIPLIVLLFLTVLNKLSDNRIGAFIKDWVDRRLASQDRRYDVVYTLLRESIQEQSRETEKLEQLVTELGKKIDEAGASLAVRQSEMSKRISSHNTHFTGQHDQLSDILKQLAIIKEKLEGITILMIQFERKVDDGKTGIADN